MTTHPLEEQAKSAAEAIAAWVVAPNSDLQAETGMARHFAALILQHLPAPDGEIDAELERITAMSDEEIIAETIAAGEDPAEVAKRGRATLEAAIIASRALDAAATEHAKAQSNSEFQRGLMHDAFLAGAEYQRMVAYQARSTTPAPDAERATFVDEVAEYFGQLARDNPPISGYEVRCDVLDMLNKHFPEVTITAEPQAERERVAEAIDVQISNRPIQDRFGPISLTQEHAAFVRDLLRSRPAQADGWVMVPRIPTDAMVRAVSNIDAAIDVIWGAMLEAAPPSPTQCIRALASPAPGKVEKHDTRKSPCPTCGFHIREQQKPAYQFDDEPPAEKLEPLTGEERKDVEQARFWIGAGDPTSAAIKAGDAAIRKLLAIIDRRMGGEKGE